MALFEICLVSFVDCGYYFSFLAWFGLSLGFGVWLQIEKKK